MDKKILFFDDEKNIAETMQKNLELFGYNVTLVSSIADLLEEIARDIDYDLIIMDIMAPIPYNDDRNRFSMSEISNMCNGIKVGEVLVDKIRQIDKYINIPILIYSARSDVKTFTKSKHLRKPALVKTVIEEIEKLLNNK